ncbi:RNA polymerase sigma-70 factor [uncultured Mucilaginibacter sp.]|uniref:RNA polymerase sigma factor n=1 Tax=uncultured Mucilaginibacter sp. TaxID=797541 RepID=UPI0025CD600B|nr:RNA polymerase sigma-70 factor [uncultured Mucilaginibacter sp.]
MARLTEIIEHELVERLRNDDETAFNLLYKHYSKPIYTRIVYLVKDADVADELLQDLFLKVWSYRGTLAADKSFQAYLYTIAQNLVYNYFRKAASERLLIEALLNKSETDELNGEDIYQNKQVGHLIQQAVEQLTPQQKQVFTLCKIDGCSYEETGRILGISVPTVNSHLTKALQTVRVYLVKHRDCAYLLLGVYLSGRY